MKSRLILLVIIAILVVLFPLVPLLQFQLGNQVMVNGMTVSGSTVWLISIVFSMMSWFLFAWASKSIKVEGILLSIISGAVLIIPFHDVLGPMASVIVGLVAGFVAFMFHKHMITRDNKSLIITITTVAASYLVLTMMIVLVTFSSVWDGNGIGEWSGTAEGMERTVQIFGFSFIIGNTLIVNPNECNYPDENVEMVPCVVRSAPLNLDPDLSPSYALDFMGGFFYLTILPLSALFVGIAALFLVPYFILKRKKIPSKPYMALILSGILLYFGIPNFQTMVSLFLILITNNHLMDSNVISGLIITIIPSIVGVPIAGILLYRSSVIRKLIKK